MGPPRLTLLAAVAVVIGLLAGCSDDPPVPKIEESDSPAVSSDPPSSPAGPDTTEASPTTPPAADTPRDFVLKYEAASYAMQASGDVSPFLALTDGCRSCQRSADAVSAVYQDGGRIQIPTWSVRQIEQVGRVDEVRVMEYELVARSFSVLDRDGKVVERYPGGVSRFQMNIERIDGAWTATRLSVLVD